MFNLRGGDNDERAVQYRQRMRGRARPPDFAYCDDPKTDASAGAHAPIDTPRSWAEQCEKLGPSLIRAGLRATTTDHPEQSSREFATLTCTTHHGDRSSLLADKCQPLSELRSGIRTASNVNGLMRQH